MGLKTKVTKIGTSDELIAGVFVATIIEFRGAVNKDGHYILNRYGENGYEVTYELSNGLKFTEILWYSVESIWRLRNLLKSILIYSDVINYDDIIGKKLWICLAEEYAGSFQNKESKRIVSFNYAYYKSDDCKPAILGDPEKNNGVPTDAFIIVRKINLQKVEFPKQLKEEKVISEPAIKGIEINNNFLEEEKEEEIKIEDDNEEEFF
jgi:hypothetical protein